MSSSSKKSRQDDRIKMSCTQKGSLRSLSRKSNFDENK